MLFIKKYIYIYIPVLYTVYIIIILQDPSPSYSNRAAARCVLLHEFCPALHAILEDGLKVSPTRLGDQDFDRVESSQGCGAGPPSRRRLQVFPF